AQRNAVHRGFLRSSIDSESSVVTAQLLFDKRKRSRGPIRRLFGGAARSPRGWALVGGGYLIGTYRRPMKPWSSKATGPRSQDARTVSGGCTSTGTAWLFCSSISRAAFSISSVSVDRYERLRCSTTPRTIVTTM